MKKTKAPIRNSKKLAPAQNRNKLYQYLFILLFAVIGSVLLLRSFAATGQLYLLPSASSVEMGQQLTVQVRLNPQTEVFGVQDVIVRYDPAKLDYISSDSTGSPFDDLNNPPGPIIGTGSLEYNQASLSSTASQDFLIANITFQAKVGSGTTTLSVIGNAENNSGPTDPTGTSVNVGLTGTVTPPPPPPPPTAGSATYTIEGGGSTAVGKRFSLKVYVNVDKNVRSGEVKVNLPAGLVYNAPIKTKGSAFTTVTTGSGTTPQLVHLQYSTTSNTLIGKLLVATLDLNPVQAGTATITLNDALARDVNNEVLTTATRTHTVTISPPKGAAR